MRRHDFCPILIFLGAEGKLDYKMPRSPDHVSHKKDGPTYIPNKLNLDQSVEDDSDEVCFFNSISIRIYCFG